MVTDWSHSVRGASATARIALITVRAVTVAVMVKVFDGIVLAADSATTLTLHGPNGEVVGHQVYNSANKVFHLHRGLPVGAATWGLGQVGNGSIASLAKDLRRRLMGADPSHPDWELDPATYTIEGVAQRMLELFFDELFSQLHSAPTPQPLGFVVAGYGGGSSDSEVWTLSLQDPATRPAAVKLAGGDQSGWAAFAQSDAVNRLFNGYDGNLVAALTGKVDAAELTTILHEQHRMAAPAAMPFMDAINLAGFMVDVTAGYSRFLLGPDSVGGPTEVAGISRHEGFKWVSRKHYYNATLNPEGQNGS